jgi:hypothetical protein
MPAQRSTGLSRTTRDTAHSIVAVSETLRDAVQREIVSSRSLLLHQLHHTHAIPPQPHPLSPFQTLLHLPLTTQQNLRRTPPRSSINPIRPRFPRPRARRPIIPQKLILEIRPHRQGDIPRPNRIRRSIQSIRQLERIRTRKGAESGDTAYDAD